jgi:NAD(P)-dependent dehydrogenase (short-subunit alcohol dehydrogenase family)
VTLKGKDRAPVCFITGGASGIGAATVDAFAAAGYRVAFGDVQGGKGKAIEKKLGRNAFFQRFDVSSEPEFTGAVKAVIGRWGRLDCLVNNAAIAGVLGPIAEIPLEEYEYACGIIQRSVFLGMREAARVMQPRRRGAIVNIASIAGLAGAPYVAAYCAAKHGVIGLTRALALEFARKNITVNAVCPAYTETDMVGAAVANIVAKTGRSADEARAELVRRNPQGRLMQPQEVANTVLWLCLPGSEAITGQAISVSGGEVM